MNTQIKETASSQRVMDIQEDNVLNLSNVMLEAWRKITPFWPLKNFVATNPLQGLEDLPFEQAITMGQSYFQSALFPAEMGDINRETIKWCQAFFDEGQATIAMPFREQGLYKAWRQLVLFDKRLHREDKESLKWLANLPLAAEQVILDCLDKLRIPLEKRSLFLTLLLTTLPGWASYIKYKAEWDQSKNATAGCINPADYLAMRLVITYLLWPDAANLVFLHQPPSTISQSNPMQRIINAENNYQKPLLKGLSQAVLKKKVRQELPAAQLVFCIDVRSEPFRRAIEAQGNYETFGFAGFFGVPVTINNPLLEESYASCPVLLSPRHVVKEKGLGSQKVLENHFKQRKKVKKISELYCGLKYTFTTPFVLAEMLGFWSGLWMFLRTMLPTFAMKLKQNVLQIFHPIPTMEPVLALESDGSGIALDDQCSYAETSLRMMGLTEHFSPLVILCGHGSATQNNAYQSALDCGACGGHHGAPNARILAAILNQAEVRKNLAQRNIMIPAQTQFIAALHNTTTDEVTLYDREKLLETTVLQKLKKDLRAARVMNSHGRCQKMGYIKAGLMKEHHFVKHVEKRSQDWAQTRPEWGLARNAAFIVAPRFLTEEIDLDGRAFLHSYNWQQDKDGASLTTILTAPMIVAQWINSQYLFSLLDNVAYGSGSKVTQNVTGKMGIMQGNASDLMHGLPLQSIFISDKKAYHEAIRLLTIVYAPRFYVERIVSQQGNLAKLFKNAWVSLVCIDPEDGGIYHLLRDLTWSKTS